MQSTATHRRSQSKFKFLLGGLLIVAAVVYLIASSTQANAQYFLTVDELNARKTEMVNKDVRISGAVVGDSIQYDSKTLTLKFTVVHIPGDNKVIDEQGGLAEVLHVAVGNKTAQRLNVVYNGVKPDLLKNEAQAIMTGKLNPDGTFSATELLLKCPTRYEEAVPAQSSEK